MSRALLVVLLFGCGARTGLAAEEDAGAPATPEICDGVDDDGDGSIDEGIAPQSCGVGACAVDAPGCVDGVVPPCVPGPPGVETCSSGDEDCDGRVDEGLGFGPLDDPILISRPEVDLGPFNGDLVETDFGLLAFYRVSFDGSRPMPNTYVVLLNPDGFPRGDEPLIVFDRPTTNGPRAAVSDADLTAIVYCGRVLGTGNDVTAAAIVDGNGVLRFGETTAAGVDSACGATDPEILWTTERHLVAWTDNRSGGTGTGEMNHDTQLAVMDAEIASQTSRDYSEAGFDGDLSASPRMGQSGERVLLAWGVRPEENRPRSELRLQALDARGEEVGERARLAPPPPRPGTDRADWGAMVIVPRGDGFLLLSAQRTREGGLLALEVDANGRPGTPRYVADFEDALSHLRGAPTEAGGAYLAMSTSDGSELARVDRDGGLVDRQPIDLDGDWFVAWPAIAPRDGRVFVSWTRLYEDRNSELYVRPFGCVP